MEVTLHGNFSEGQGSNKSIGKWFENEVVENMFSRYYDDDQSFTIFISNFMIYGLSYVFMCASRVLKNDCRVLRARDIIQEVRENIEAGYVKKYRLDCIVNDFYDPVVF